MVHSRHACSKAATSNWAAGSGQSAVGSDFPPLLPTASCLMPAFRNVIRLSEARLQAVSSRNMYSEHGFEARIGPDFGQVCQSLMVVWNWMPGSAEAQAAWPIWSHRLRAFSVLTVLPLRRAVRFQSLSSLTAFRNSSVTRTELLEFWPDTVR